MTHNQNELLRKLYAASGDDTAFNAVLQGLADFFGCPSSILIYADAVTPDLEVMFGHGTFFDPDNLERYFKDYRSDDPAPQVLSRLAVGEADTTDRLFSAELRQTNRFIREFYEPLGLRETLVGPFKRVEGRYGILAVHRGPDRSAFTDADILAFQALMPHFAGAMELRNAFLERARTLSSLERVFDSYPSAV